MQDSDRYAIDITPAMIEFHYRRGRQLQAEAIANGIARLFRRRRAAAAPAMAPVPAVAHDVVNALTAIRTTAEMLRDHPEIGPKDRTHFLDALLTEEARLEGLLPQALRALGGGGGSLAPAR